MQLWPCLFVLIQTYTSFSAADDNVLIVESAAGRFQGKSLTSPHGRPYSAFMGIPFALPPIGKLRFAKPVQYPKSDELYNATTLASMCIQPLGVDLGDPGSEDCLYLNVYVPATGTLTLNSNEKESKSVDELKKVFVYIYGGSFFMGSAREYIPGDLVTMADIIVVTFNYRLSWLGFLKGETPDLPGNQGLWDQLMALNWVKDNIISFGGDPADVTLGGNSMGGESISALSIVKQGQGLFTKGLIMSGSMFDCPSTFGSSDRLLRLLTDRVGCASSSEEALNISQVVQCLKDLPAEKFILPMENNLTNVFTSIDGELFTAPIKTLIQNHQYLEDVGFFSRDYIVSVVNNEGAVEFHGPFKGTKEAPDEIDAKSIHEHFHIPISVAARFIQWYKQPGHFTFHPIYDLFADPILVMPAFKFLEIFLSKLEGEKGKSYFLYFDHEPSYMPSTVQGMVHGLDLTYLFDLAPSEVLRFYYGLNESKGFTPWDYELKETYINILADFMKTGNPSLSLTKANQIVWPSFQKDSEHYLSLSLRPVIKNFPLLQRRHLWNKVLPELLAAKVNEKEEL